MSAKQLAPATNPDIGKPAIAHLPSQEQNATTRPRKKSKTRVKGGDLVPKKGEHNRIGGRVYKYWVGVTSTCPVEHIDIAGINFPKVNEDIVKDPLRTGTMKRVPVIGAIVLLTENKMRKLIERLPMTVIRFMSDDGDNEEAGTGQNVGDNHRRPRRGQLITIPSAKDLAQKRKSGKPARDYVEDEKRDVPAARYLFAQICTDQDRGSRGSTYPETLETAGIEWPDDIEMDKIAKLLGT